MWRNGRRRGLKIPRPQGCAGSSPAIPTMFCRCFRAPGVWWRRLRDKRVLESSVVRPIPQDGPVPAAGPARELGAEDPSFARQCRREALLAIHGHLSSRLKTGPVAGLAPWRPPTGGGGESGKQEGRKTRALPASPLCSCFPDPSLPQRRWRSAISRVRGQQIPPPAVRPRFGAHPSGSGRAEQQRSTLRPEPSAASDRTPSAMGADRSG